MAVPPEKSWLPGRPAATRVAVWVLVLGALAYLLYWVATGTTAVPKKVTSDVPVVHLEHVIPPIEHPPEPQKQKFQEQPKDTTPREKPAPEPPPPSPPALATAGEGPPDAFGLEGRPDGSDYIGGPGGNGTGGGGGGSLYGWYAQMLQERVKALLRKDPRLSHVRYRVNIQVWLSADGVVQRTAYLESTGNAAIDKPITEALKAKLPEPPAGLPQPIVMRLTSAP